MPRSTQRTVAELEDDLDAVRAEVARLTEAVTAAVIGLEAERAASEALWRALLAHVADDTRHTGRRPT